MPGALHEEPGSGAGSPCRLFVYLARQAPIGVVLRRGPSDWARLSVWHTDSDIFEHGQWIRGRVYERRSDLSADGSLFTAFVRQSGSQPAEPTADSWVAISRPPFFAALAVWFIGGTYHAGAFFPQRDSVWHGLEDPSPDVGRLPEWLRTTSSRDIPYTENTNESTNLTVHFNRLLRDGWQKQESSLHSATWERGHPTKSLCLSMRQRFEGFDRYGGPYVVEYSVRDADGVELQLGEATWADWDHRGRLVLARHGRLVSSDEGIGFRQLEEFNDQVPDPQPAPPWVKVWPGHAPRGAGG